MGRYAEDIDAVDEFADEEQAETTQSGHPLLYYRSKAGALHQWRVWVEGDTIYTEYGQVGGKQQRTPGKKCIAKNVGRSNETTPEDQAEQEAAALWLHKKDRKYSEDPAEAQQLVRLPMLAHRMPDPKKKPRLFAKKVRFPIDIQPKLDGVRCRAYWEDGVVKLMSCEGKQYAVPHVAQAVADILPKGDELDGELYVHGLHYDDIISLVKRNRPESKAVSLWAYDMPIIGGREDLPWSERCDALFDILWNQRDDFPVVVTETRRIKDPDVIMVNHDAWVAQGFEGLMIRNLDSLYRWGFRSHDLLKVKVFDDDEFEVVGCVEGEGKYRGCAVFICKVGGKEFRVSPKCSMRRRAEYWNKRDQFIGEYLTVQFQGYTSKGLPRFPVGKCFRADEDLPKRKR